LATAAVGPGVGHLDLKIMGMGHPGFSLFVVELNFPPVRGWWRRRVGSRAGCDDLLANGAPGRRRWAMTGRRSVVVVLAVTLLARSITISG